MSQDHWQANQGNIKACYKLSRRTPDGLRREMQGRATCGETTSRRHPRRSYRATYERITSTRHHQPWLGTTYVQTRGPDAFLLDSRECADGASIDKFVYPIWFYLNMSRTRDTFPMPPTSLPWLIRRRSLKSSLNVATCDRKTKDQSYHLWYGCFCPNT